MPAPKSILLGMRLSQNAQALFRVGCEDPEISGDWIAPLSSLNVFVGPNNCGKSRILRTLFEEYRPYHTVDGSVNRSAIIPDEPAYAELFAVVAEARKAFRPLILQFPVRKDTYGESRVAPLRWLWSAIEGDMGFVHWILENNAKQMEQWFRSFRVARERLTNMLGPWKPGEAETMCAATDRIIDKLSRVHTRWAPKEIPVTRVYIPVLRSLRPSLLATSPDEVLKRRDTFEHRTAEDYFATLLERDPESTGKMRVKPDTEVRICTGQSYFNDVLEAAAGTPEQRQVLSQFEEYLGTHFFENQRVELTPRVRDDRGKGWNNVLHLKVGNGVERPIHHIGDGLSQLIIMTLLLFLYKSRRLLLFIEEPEVYLHPGFQRLLIESFLSLDCELGRQVFISTHSNQFLDATLDSQRVSVFAQSKESPRSNGAASPTFLIRPRSNASRPVLRDLGVLNSSVLLANCTIWVEGISDRLYFRHYLRLLMDRPDLTGGKGRYYEDIHYAFVEYSGANVTHLSLLDEARGINAEFLCGEMCMVADSDNAPKGSKKAERHQRLRNLLGDSRFRLLDCLEVENLISPKVIAAVVTQRGDPIGNVGFGQDEYRRSKLGEFIESKVVGSTSQPKRRYADDGGSIRGKAEFAESAVAQMHSWEDLSGEAKELALWLFRFIESQNSGPKPVHG